MLSSLNEGSQESNAQQKQGRGSFGLSFALLISMNSSAMPSNIQPFPVTETGKRNFAWAAVHSEAQPSSAATLPTSTEGSFWDLVDVINPLQHIPIIGNFYRAVTGDTMAASSNIFGGLLFGGPLGFMASTASTIISETLTTESASSSAAKVASSAYMKTEALRI